jgi:hypothetical protein
MRVRRKPMSNKDQYVVKDGDDVFLIAKKLFDRDLRKAFEVMESNPGVCRLYPGLVLDMPEVEEGAA